MNSVHSVSPVHSSSSTTDQEGAKRAKKFRACDLCRQKKIRCDYDQAYPNNACISCRNYGKTCTFAEPSKRKGPSKGYVEGLQNRLKRMEQLLSNMLQEMPADQVANVTAELEEQEALEAQESPPVSKRPRRDNKRTHFFAGSSSGYYLLNRLFPQDESASLLQKYPRAIDNQDDDLIIERNIETTDDNQRKKEWKLQPKGLVDYLIQIYFDRINYKLPILDKDAFYNTYHKEGPESPSIAPISIHICGKICKMLSANDPIFKKYNVDRSKMLEDFNKCLKFIHQPDYMEPKIQLVQNLLMNVANSESWFLDSTCWISSGMAIKMAQDLGLHRSSFQNQGLSEAESAGRKRLWWSAYVIDRFVSASVSRPMTISDADCDLEYPDETEYVEFVHTIKLSRIVGEAHKALRSPKFQQLPDRKARTENTCRYIQQRLDEWRNDLPPQFRLTDKELEQMFQPGLLDPKLKSKLNSGAGQFHLAYITVCLMTKKHLMCTASYYLEIARECQKLIRESVYILSSTHLESLLYSWCFSSFFLSEALGVIFLICRISDPEIASEARGFCESLKKCYGYLEKITGRPSVVPYIEVLLDISSRASGSSSQDAIQENQKLEYDSLAESIDGIEWGELAKLLLEADAGLSGENVT